MTARCSFRSTACILLLCCCAWLAATSTTLQAQDPRFSVERLTSIGNQEIGAVFSIMQDQYGYIWFGTVHGLQRYDGYSFRSYYYDAFDPTGLSGYKVTALTEDSSGGIWAGTLSNGLNRLDRRTDTFTHLRHNAQDPNSLSSDLIQEMKTDRSGNVWISTTRGLDRIDPRTGTVRRYGMRIRKNGEASIPTSLHIDRRGRLWVCTRNGDTSQRATSINATISVYDAATDSFTTWTLSQTDRRDSWILGDRPDGTIDLGYLTHNNQNKADPDFIRRFNPTTGKVQVLHIAVSNTDLTRGKYALTMDRDGNCWYAAVAGTKSAQGFSPFYSLHCEPVDVRANVQRQQRFATDGSILTGLPRKAFEDRTGTMWIGMEDGLVRVSRLGSGITTWRHDVFDPTTLSALRIRSVLQDRTGALWVSTDVGLNRHVRARNAWKRYYAGDTTRGALPNSTVNVLYEDVDGTLLLGTNGGLAAYARQKDAFYDPYPNIRGAVEDLPIVWSILRDRTGHLWLGTRYGGLARSDRSGKKVEWFQYDRFDDGSILPGGVWCLYEDSRGTIWAGTDGGVCRWIPTERRFARYASDTGDVRSRTGSRIWSIHEDRDGTLWTLSFGGGLSRYDRRTDSFTNVTNRDRRITNSVVGLLEDNDGLFWIATTQGLARWDRQRDQFRLYDRGDGLQGNEFTFKAHYKAADGTLYFGGATGLSAFDPHALRSNPHVPPVVITGFRIFDSLATSGLNDHDTVRLTHAQNFFSFEFSALNYINPARNQYAYKLDGVDPSWVRTTGDRRIASYTDLAPGTYRFRVRGSNNDGVWNDHGTMITVIIDPPWWGTWFFRGLLFVAVSALVITGIQYRTRIVRRIEQEKLSSSMQATLESQEEERQRIARDLHDGIGQLLAAASINLARLRDALTRRAHFGDVAEDLREPLDRTEAILRRTTNDVRVLSHALGTSTLQEMGLSAALGELLTSVSSNERTKFTYLAMGLEERLPESAEIGLFRIAQELITNVIRHAGASDASVQIMQEQREIRLTVEDNGIGFDMQKARNGMGLRNITARAAAIGGSLHYDSRPGQGTTVTVIVSIH